MKGTPQEKNQNKQGSLEHEVIVRILLTERDTCKELKMCRPHKVFYHVGSAKVRVSYRVLFLFQAIR